MANVVLTPDIIAKEALMLGENGLGFLDTFHRAHESEFSQQVNGYSVGETVSIRRPADFTVREGPVASAQDVLEGKVPLTVDKQRGIDFEFTSADLTMDIKDMSERVIKPAMENLVNNIAQDCLSTFYKGVYNWVGTPGQKINSLSDFSKGPERLSELSTPYSNRTSVLSVTDNWGLIGSQSELNNEKLVRDAYTEGRLGMVGGISTHESQVVATHTVGAHGGTPVVDGAAQNVTYAASKDTWTQTLVTDGWSTSDDLKEGDVFTIAGVNMVNKKTKADTGIVQQFVITADVTTNASASSDTNLTISPPIITSGPHQTVTAAPADNAAITYVGTAGEGYRQNLAYHKNCFALAMVPMVSPPGAVDVARQSSNGMSVRVIPVYDGTNDKSLWRLDVLYGIKVIDPRFATRVSGTA